jgi:hypothetical protein
MKLIFVGRLEDFEQMIEQMIRERGEKLKITVLPGPLEYDGMRRYQIEIEKKKNAENQGVVYS